jgi:hypothetical protein
VCKSEQNKRQYEENRVRPDAHGISKLYNDNDGILQLKDVYILSSFPSAPFMQTGLSSLTPTPYNDAKKSAKRQVKPGVLPGVIE